ncbi:MAG: hypothetical protein Q4G05_00925 [Clostridia bacterium]|nr:hypothetical protein [Clostridia bacterium]
MFNHFFKSIGKIMVLMMLFVIFITVFFAPTLAQTSLKVVYTEGEFAWPVPNCNTISSFFGKRVSPTTGASSYHKGIDIAAREGTEFIAVIDGIISFRDFLRWRWLYHYIGG